MSNVCTSHKMYFCICMHMHVELLVHPMNICSALYSGVTAIICEFIKNINVRHFYSDACGNLSIYTH